MSVREKQNSVDSTEIIIPSREHLDTVEVRVVDDDEYSSGSEYEATNLQIGGGYVDLADDVEVKRDDEGDDDRGVVVTMTTTEDDVERTGEMFDHAHFPNSDERVELKQYSNTLQSVENSMKELRGFDFKSVEIRQNCWSVAEEVANNDDAALRNMVTKVKKGNELVEKLIYNYTELNTQQKVDIIYQLCNINNSFRTQSQSLRTALDEYNFRRSNHASERRNTDIAGIDLDKMYQQSSIQVTQDKSNRIAKSLVCKFGITKVNKLNKNTPRILEIDTSLNTLSICKKVADEEMDFVLNHNTLIALIQSKETPEELTIQYFKSQDKLLRNQKIMICIFQSPEERERFMRLAQLHILSKSVSKVDKIEYKPVPLRIRSVNIKAKFKAIEFPVTEIASRLHNAWMLKRLDEGWSFGKTLDQKKKTHPSLIRFEDLSQEEKARNEHMVNITLEAIYALGFEITLRQKHSISEKGHSDISSELLQLIEFLAENAHDIWAQKKIDEGWKFGTSRDNEKKLHPNLIPFCDLNEADKEYDREATRSIIARLSEHNYVISKVENTFLK